MPDLLMEKDGPVVVLTLNRPARRNAMTLVIAILLTMKMIWLLKPSQEVQVVMTQLKPKYLLRH